MNFRALRPRNKKKKKIAMLGSLFYFFSNPSGLSLLVLLLYFSAIVSSLVISFIILTFSKKNVVLLKSTKTFFSSLTFGKKITFLNFCVFSAFPNLVFVNNGFSFIGNYLLTSLIIVGSFFFPWVILFFFIRLVFVLKSGVFGILYEHVGVFQRHTIQYVFNGDDKFSKEFILYFYGNVWRAAWYTTKAFFGASFSFKMYELAKENEQLRIEKEVGSQMRDIFHQHTAAGHTLTPTEAREYYFYFIAEAEKKAPLVKFHRSAEGTTSKISDFYLEKHFPESFPKDPKIELDLLKAKIDLAQKEVEFKQTQDFNNLYRINSVSPVKSKELSSIGLIREKGDSGDSVD